MPFRNHAPKKRFLYVDFRPSKKIDGDGTIVYVQKNCLGASLRVDTKYQGRRTRRSLVDQTFVAVRGARKDSFCRPICLSVITRQKKIPLRRFTPVLMPLRNDACLPAYIRAFFARF